MAVVKKTCLVPGTYQAPGHTVNATSDRIRGWVDKFNLMRQRNLNIPIPFGHLRDAVPSHWDDGQRKAYWESKYNAGYVKSLRQTATGEFEAEIDCPGLSLDTASGCLVDPATGAAIKEVSIGILPTFRDGQGNVYQDVIGHIALVPHPVWAGQDGFKNLSMGQPDDMVCLSVGGTSWQQAGLTLKGAEMADKMPDDVLPGDKSKSEPKEEPKSFGDDDGKNDTGEFNRLLTLLAQMKVKLPDNTTKKNLSERLLMTLEALVSAGVFPAAPSGDPTLPPPGSDLAKALPEAPPIIGMSHNGHKLTPMELKFIKREQDAHSQKAREIVASLEKRGVSKAIVDELSAQIGTTAIHLSLSADGDPVPGPLMVQLSLLDRALPLESPLVKAMSAEVVPHPLDAKPGANGGDVSPENPLLKYARMN